MRNPVLSELVQSFVQRAAEVEKEARYLSSTMPHDALRKALSDAFWEMMSGIASIESALSEDEKRTEKASFQATLLPILGRSKHFSRSLLKPNGYSGDFQIVEWMYDLEHSDCHDPFQISFVNILDSVFRSIHSVESIWERRRWLGNLIVEEINKLPNSSSSELRVLDIACGSARYISDALKSVGPNAAKRVHVTLCDQDPAAIAYAQYLLRDSGAAIEANCIPVKKLSALIEGRSFEIVIASGLFDYFSTRHTTRQVANLATNVTANGLLAFTNYTPEDASALAKEWVAEWSLIFKDEEEVRSILESSNLISELHYSQNRSLIMAAGRPSRPA